MSHPLHSMTRLSWCAIHLFMIIIHIGNAKCEMSDEVCTEGERDVSAEVKITNEEISNIRQKMERRLRINIIIRNYPRTKMTLNLSHLRRFKNEPKHLLCAVKEPMSRNFIFMNFFGNTFITTAAKVLCNLPDKFAVLCRSVKAWREK